MYSEFSFAQSLIIQRINTKHVQGAMAAYLQFTKNNHFLICTKHLNFSVK